MPVKLGADHRRGVGDDMARCVRRMLLFENGDRDRTDGRPRRLQCRPAMTRTPERRGVRRIRWRPWSMETRARTLRGGTARTQPAGRTGPVHHLGRRPPELRRGRERCRLGARRDGAPCGRSIRPSGSCVRSHRALTSHWYVVVHGKDVHFGDRGTPYSDIFTDGTPFRRSRSPVVRSRLRVLTDEPRRHRGRRAFVYFTARASEPFAAAVARAGRTPTDATSPTPTQPPPVPLRLDRRDSHGELAHRLEPAEPRVGAQAREGEELLVGDPVRKPRSLFRRVVTHRAAPPCRSGSVRGARRPRDPGRDPRDASSR